MEIKKAAHADLERSKTLNLLLGLVVALAVTFVALQWRSYAEAIDHTQNLNISDLEDTMLIEDLQQEEPQEPEPIQQPEPQIEAQLPEEFTVVEDDKEVAKISFVSQDQDKPLPPPAPVAPAPVEEETDVIFEVVEEAPQFTENNGNVVGWIGSRIKYPEVAAENGIQGRVTIGFVVEKDGSITQVQVLRGVDAELDKEAVRVVKSMPKWKAGRQGGKPVRAKYTVPVVFRLQ